MQFILKWFSNSYGRYTPMYVYIKKKKFIELFLHLFHKFENILRVGFLSIIF